MQNGAKEVVVFATVYEFKQPCSRRTKRETLDDQVRGLCVGGARRWAAGLTLKALNRMLDESKVAFWSVYLTPKAMNAELLEPVLITRHPFQKPCPNGPVELCGTQNVQQIGARKVEAEILRRRHTPTIRKQTEQIASAHGLHFLPVFKLQRTST